MVCARVIRPIFLGLLLAGCGGLSVTAVQAQSADSTTTPPGSTAKADPLSIGKAALQHGDFGAARTFFAAYAADNPKDAEAMFFLAGTDVNLKKYDDAVKEFQAAIELKPDAWAAHQNLALTYARMQNWPAFDKERAVIKAARDAKTPGLKLDGHDIIDVLDVNGVTYQVWYFYTPYGQFHTRYAFLHFDAEGKADNWIQCESDDSDQGFFQQKHPKEAAAGDRSYSLDTYSRSEKGMTQGLIKFYQDGEPTYETVRADALKALTNQSKPAATMSVPAKK
jgi:tetratricopeptide (TPR) repeat protein